MTSVLLLRKLVRDIAQHWTQFVSVFVMATLSMVIYAGLEGAWRGMEQEVADFEHVATLPDAWVFAASITEADERAFRQLPGVHRTTAVTRIDVKAGETGSSTLTLSTIDDSGINSPAVRTGSAPTPTAPGLWLDERYAAAHGLSLGDPVTVHVGHTTARLPLAGTILSADKVAFTGGGLIAPDAALFGHGLVAERTLRITFGVDAPPNELRVIGDPDTVRRHAPSILGPRLGTFADRHTLGSVSAAHERIGQIRSLSFMFSALFLLLALLSIHTSIKRLVDIQQRDIATLRALGIDNASIGRHYATFGLVTAGVGGVIGLLVARPMSEFVLTTQQSDFALRSWVPSNTWLTPALLALLIAVCVSAAYGATGPARTREPAEGMRPAMGTGRRSLLERRPGLWARLAPGGRWTVRDAEANGVRLAMGVVASAGCMMLLTAGFGMPDSLHRQVADSYENQYRYGALVTVNPGLDAVAREAIAHRAGGGQWMAQGPAWIRPGGEVDRILTIVDEGDGIVLPGPDGTPVSLVEGAAISLATARATGISVGDRVQVLAAGHERSIELRVRHLVDVSEPQGLFVSSTAWQDAGGTFTPTRLLTARAADAEHVRELPGVTGVVTRAEQRANAESLIAGLDGVFSLIKAFAVLLAIVVLYNLGALSFTERARDYATLRVLGFRLGEIRGLAAGENLLTTAVGWLIGIPLGWVFLDAYVGLFSTFRASYTPWISPQSTVIASLITIGFALSTTLLLTGRVRRLDMVSALKGVE